MPQDIRAYLSVKLLKRVLLTVAPFLTFLIISLIYFAPQHLNQLSQAIFNNGGDPQQFVWLYNWWPYSLIHHLDPFITHYAWYPLGYNLSWTTSISGLAFMMAPVTLLGNALLSFNVMALLAPALAATGCFYLLWYLCKNWLASLIGAYVYGFSSFTLGHLLGHPQLYADFLLPIIILLFIMKLRGRIKSWLAIILIGGLLALQFSISEEIFAMFIFFGVMTLVLYYWLMPDWRTALRHTIKITAWSLLITLILISPYLYNMAISAQEVPAVIHPISAFSMNLANYFIPTPLTWMGGNSLTGLTHYFTGNLSENGGYIGLPLLFILAFITLKYWRHKQFKILIIIEGIIMVLALGPNLHLIGQAGSFLPMPWRLLDWLPFLKSAQPDRFSVYIFLVLAILLAYWLTWSKDHIQTYIKYIVALLGILFLIPNPGLYHWTNISVPAYFKPNIIRRQLPAGSNVLILPFEKLGSSAYYQYYSGMYFTQTGAYIGFVPNQYANNPVILSLLNNKLSPEFVTQLTAFCTTHHIRQIIYTPQTTPDIVNALTDTSWTITRNASVNVVHVP